MPKISSYTNNSHHSIQTLTNLSTNTLIISVGMSFIIENGKPSRKYKMEQTCPRRLCFILLTEIAKLIWKARKVYLPIIKLSSINMSKRPLTKKMVNTEAASSHLQVCNWVWCHVYRSSNRFLDNNRLWWKFLLVKWLVTINRWRSKICWGWGVKCLCIYHGRILHRLHFCSTISKTRWSQDKGLIKIKKGGRWRKMSSMMVSETKKLMTTTSSYNDVVKINMALLLSSYGSWTSQPSSFGANHRVVPVSQLRYAKVFTREFYTW